MCLHFKLIPTIQYTQYKRKRAEERQKYLFTSFIPFFSETVCLGQGHPRKPNNFDCREWLLHETATFLTQGRKLDFRYTALNLDVNVYWNQWKLLCKPEFGQFSAERKTSFRRARFYCPCVLLQPKSPLIMVLLGDGVWLCKWEEWSVIVSLLLSELMLGGIQIRIMTGLQRCREWRRAAS